MRNVVIGLFLTAIVLGAGPAWADSFTGSLPSPDSTFSVYFTLPTDASLAIQTYGFGGTGNAPGGTNDAGQVIAPGGFDSMISLFSGFGSSASILFLGSDPAASADTLSNYVPPCAPAGPASTVDVGGPACGDARLMMSLGPGNYTLLLTDASFVPLAVNPGPPGASTIGDGFTDLTGGVFQTCNVSDAGFTCITPTAEFAVDITGLPEGSTTSTELPVPEPGALMLLSAGLCGLIPLDRRRNFFRTLKSRCAQKGE
ncbi:MAG TPA: DVUA0089 family protein [Candidatus Binatia bacterium]|nr:DVUA0089 family protein [Candidatus Binatia bacterium]